MRIKTIGGAVLPLSLLLALSSCTAARVAGKAVTLPVKAVGKGVDLATTSQSEADEKRGRKLREREEQLGKLSRQRDDATRDCLDDGDRSACDRMRQLDYHIETLRKLVQI